MIIIRYFDFTLGHVNAEKMIIRSFDSSLGHVNAEQVAMRPRKSPYPIITVDEALAAVLENTHVLHTEDVSIKGKMGSYCFCCFCFLLS